MSRNPEARSRQAAVLPCPVCGAVPTITHKSGGILVNGWQEVRCCPGAGMDGWNQTREQTIAEWNRRVRGEPSKYGPTWPPWPAALSTPATPNS